MTKPLGAQTNVGLPYVENYFQPSDDLRSSLVYAIDQLPEGLIVAASERGILVFDGNDWSKVVDGRFLSVAYDTNSHILFAGTDKDFGYLTYDQALQSFKYVALSELSPRIIKNTWNICPTYFGTFFLVNHKDVFKYDFNGLHYVDLNGFIAKRCFCLDKNLLLVDDSVGMGIITPRGFVILSTSHKDIYRQAIVGFIPLNDKNLYLVLTRTGNLYTYDLLKDKFVFIRHIEELGRYPAREMTELKDSNFAVRTVSAGLYVIDRQGDILMHLHHDNSLLTNTLNDVFVDDYGEIWVATSRFVSRIYYSTPYRFADEKSGFTGDISDFTVYDGQIFLGTTSGLYYLDTVENRFRTITNQCVFSKPGFLNITVDGKEYLLASGNWQIILVDENKNVKHLRKAYQVYNLTRDSKGYIYGFSSDSLFVFELTKQLELKELKSYYVKYLVDKSILFRDTVFYIYSQSHNILAEINLRQSQGALALRKIYLGNIGRVFGITNVHDSLLLLATDKGLILYNPDLQTFDFDAFKKLNQHIYGQTVRDLIRGNNGFWILTDENLIFYSLTGKDLRVFPIQSKARFYSKKLLHWNDLLVGANVYSLFFVRESDLLRFTQKSVERPVLLYIKVRDKKYYTIEGKGILTRKNDSTWYFDLPIPDRTPVKLKLGFISPYISRVYYSYRLAGMGKNWTDWTTNSEIVLPVLKAGKYRVDIRYKSEITNRIYTLSVIFEVKAPFYRSYWILVFLALVALSIVVVVVDRIIRKERRRRIIFERLVKRRTKELEMKNRLLEDQYKRLNEMTELLRQQKEEVEAQNERLRLTNLELRQLSLVAQKTNNSVLILDKKGRIEWWNEGFTRLFNHKFKLERKGIPSLIKNIRPDVFERIKNFKPSDESIEYTTREVLPDGKTELWYKTTITPVYDEQGEIYRFVVLDVDITEIKQAEKQIKKQKDALEKQTQILQKINREIEQHRMQLEIQHKEMLSSLEYAKKIQHALLPREAFAKIFPEHFILDLPKEIVSGDFYYITQKHPKIIFAIADGTGHGVPGAFMSVLGLTLLKDAIERNEQDLQPAKILNTLRNAIIKALHQFSYETHVKDGLDIALGILDINNKVLSFSGANIPLTIIRNREVLIEIRGDRMPIGIHEFAGVPFKQEELDIQEGDRIYLYTDGYVDQFGGPDSKRYKRTRLKKFLLSIQNLSMIGQKKRLVEELEQWMAGNDQIDDITMVGFEILWEHLETLNPDLEI